MERHVGGAPPPHHRGRPFSGTETAHANEYFEHFLNAATLKNILGYHRSMCELLHLKPNVFPQFYPKLRSSLTSWKAKALWKKFDSRISHKCYGKGKACHGTRVLVIGAGPCGLRTAIEAQLLGAKVVVVEKRDRLSRNNVLHLWPFVIEDLRMLGAKKFFGKFCAGAIDHISIRQLQCILLKVALLLGVEIHTEVSFERLREPDLSEKIGWRAEVLPNDHPVAQYEFDVIVGADGKRNTLQGFKRKEFRGKLAIAITANFINKKSEAEARVEEISGVAFIFNQKFFKDLQAETRIDLENIVYYKDDTHYFVMTAKKASLLEKGVIKQDLNDTEKLLAAENVDRDALQNYAREAADFSTNYQLPELEFAVNHYGQPDVAMFDFTSMYAAEYASKVIERHGTRLLTILVGDSLLEPFWPTGSGCARGFLSSLDAAWAIRSYCSGQMTALDVLAERESIYRLLAQTTPDNLNKDWKAYTLDPATRYPNLNKSVVTPLQTVCLYDTDAPEMIEKMKRASLDSLTRHEHTSKKRRRGTVDVKVVLRWLSEQLRAYDDVTVTDLISVFRPGKALCALLHHYRPDLLDYAHVVNNNEPAQRNQLAMEILEKELGVAPFMTGDELTNSDDFLTLTAFLTQLYDTFRGEIPHVKHPKLELPESQKRSEFSFKTIKTSSQANNQTSRPSSRHKRNVADVANVQKAPSSLDRKQRKRRTFERIAGPSVDYDAKLSGLKPPTNTNAEEDIASKIRSLEDKWSNRQPTEKKPKDLMRAIGKIETSDWNIKQIEKKILENKMGKPSTLNADKERVPRWSKEEFKARQTKMEKKHLDRQDSGETKFADIDRNIKQLDLKLREGTNRELGRSKVAKLTEKLVKETPQNQKKHEKPAQPKPVNLPIQNGSENCHFCAKRVYLMERLSAEGRFFHHGCFKCQYCHTQLRLGSYMFDRDGQFGYRFYCIHHFGMQGELPRPTKIARKPSERGSREVGRSPQKRPHQLSGVAGVDLLDRGDVSFLTVETPERVEFANLSSGHVSSDRDEPMDEDEWTDKNFGASANELDDSDDDFSSSLSDTDSDEEEAFDDALEQPMTKEGTMKLAQMVRNTHRKSRDSGSDGYSSSDRSSYYENTSDDSDSETATEGEDEIRARELRRREVLVEAPIVPTDTETDDTEVRKMKKSSSSEDAFRSAESDLDVNRNAVVAGKLTFTAKTEPKIGNFAKRNFLIRPDPQVQLDQPLLVIRRPPNKVNLPKEIKPKVAVNATKFDAKKYFGLPSKPLSEPPSSKPLSKCNKLLSSQPLSKKPLSNLRSFSFELKDTDLDEADLYIDQLLRNDQEDQKPSAEALSSSIEDLLQTLDAEPQKEVDQKADELLKWIEELEHQNTNVEHRKPQKGGVRKLSTDSRRFFENVLSPRTLHRSKTESQIAQKRDLDATIDVKSVLKKFESFDQSDPGKTSPQAQKGLLARKRSDSVTQKNYLAQKLCFNQPDLVKRHSLGQRDFFAQKEFSDRCNPLNTSQKDLLAQKVSLNQSDTTKSFSEVQKVVADQLDLVNEPSSGQNDFLAQKVSLVQPNPVKTSFLSQKDVSAQKECSNQPDLVKTSFPAQKVPSDPMERSSEAQKDPLAQSVIMNQPDYVTEPFSTQNDVLAQKVCLNKPDSVKTSFPAQKVSYDPLERSSEAQNDFLPQKTFSDHSDAVQSSSEAQKGTKSLEESMQELEKSVDETLENIGKGKWCGNVSVTSRLSSEYLEMAQKAQKTRPHDFSKAVESSSDSEDAERRAPVAQKPQTPKMGGPAKFPPKFGRKDPDKDCCIQ